MNLNGRISFEYDNKTLAENIARVIQTDNVIVPRALKVKSFADRTNVITTVSSEKTSTFFSTIDDLIFSENLIINILNIGV